MPVPNCYQTYSLEDLERGFSEYTCLRSNAPPYTVQTDDTAKVCFAATLGEEPEIELACVIVPKKTENWLRFSARLGDGAPEVRLERVGR